MDLGPLRALALELTFSTHGVAATVTRPAPDDDPIVTQVIWVTPTTDGFPVSADFSRREARLVLAIRKSDVPTVPLRTKVVAPPPMGGPNDGWVVDGFDLIEREHVRVIVVADPEFEAAS